MIARVTKTRLLERKRKLLAAASASHVCVPPARRSICQCLLVAVITGTRIRKRAQSGKGRKQTMNPRSPRDRLLTVEEWLRVSTCLCGMSATRSFQRRIPIVKIGRLVRIEESELEAFIDRDGYATTRPRDSEGPRSRGPRRASRAHSGIGLMLRMSSEGMGLPSVAWPSLQPKPTSAPVSIVCT